MPRLIDRPMPSVSPFHFLFLYCVLLGVLLQVFRCAKSTSVSTFWNVKKFSLCCQFYNPEDSCSFPITPHIKFLYRVPITFAHSQDFRAIWCDWADAQAVYPFVLHLKALEFLTVSCCPAIQQLTYSQTCPTHTQKKKSKYWAYRVRMKLLISRPNWGCNQRPRSY